MNKQQQSLNMCLKRSSVFGLLWLILFAEGWLGYQAISHKLSLLNILLGHALIVLLILLFVLYQYKGTQNHPSTYTFKQTQVMALLCLMLTAVMGVFGSIIAILVAMAIQLFSVKKVRNQDWLFEVANGNVSSSGNEIYARLQSEREHIGSSTHFASMQEIMSMGSTSEKREAISTMANYYVPEFSEILKAATRDKENSIRIHAATTVTNIEQSYVEKIMAIDKKLSTLNVSREVLLEAAELYYQYAHSNIGNRATEEKYYTQSLEQYDCCLKNNLSSRQKYTLTLFEISLKLGLWDRADREIESHLKLNKENNISYLEAPVFVLLCELRFQQKAYVALRTLCGLHQGYYDGDNLAELKAAELIEKWLPEYA